MDENESDQTDYRTPFLTPHSSETNRITSEPSDSNPAVPTTNDSTRTNLERALHSIREIERLYESENDESDTHDQQPTEATDDGDEQNRSPVFSTKQVLDNNLVSFHAQSSVDSECGTPSCVQETVASEEHVCPTFPELNISESVNKSTDVYVESFCVPYKQERKEGEDEILTFKQTSTFVTKDDDDDGPKKKTNDIGHIMISYNHSTRPICSRIANELKQLKYAVWIDQDNISGDIFTSMASAVENSYVVLMAINEKYFRSRYCRLEAEYSFERNKESIPMLMQAGFTRMYSNVVVIRIPDGWLGFINGSKLHIDFSESPFEESFSLLVREIKAIRMSLGVDTNCDSSPLYNLSNNNSITTMSSVYSYAANVLDWNADDVVEWLYREKLEIFQTALTNFTGATLWQLYKIKYDSPSDYYRTVESMQTPPNPLRLFYNLTFHAALESIFSSSGRPRR